MIDLAENFPTAINALWKARGVGSVEDIVAESKGVLLYLADSPPSKEMVTLGLDLIPETFFVVYYPEIAKADTTFLAAAQRVVDLMKSYGMAAPYGLVESGPLPNSVPADGLEKQG